MDFDEVQLLVLGLGIPKKIGLKICKMWIPGGKCYPLRTTVTNKKTPGKVYAGGLS
mgnify:CR=1 FL=1